MALGRGLIADPDWVRKAATGWVSEIIMVVVFRQELLDGTRAMLGVHVTSPDEPAA